MASLAHPAMRPNSTERPRWAVIGGGMLGMTMAHRLLQAGHDVTIFESAPGLGGLAIPWELGDLTWDRHYHVTLRSDSHLRSLLAELGLESDIRWVPTKTGFYTDGRLYSLSNAAEFLAFPPLRLIDKLRLAATIVYASRLKDWRKLEKISVSDWLRGLSGRRTFEKIWLPLLRAKLGESYRQASAAFIWAIIARLYAARRSGMKTESFGYVPGGYARILRTFQERLEVEGAIINTSQTAAAIETNEDSGDLSVRFADGRREGFNRVVVTVPGPVAAKLSAGLSADELSRLNGVKYQGIICASLLLKKPLADYYVTNITDSWVPFTGVIEMSALVDRSEFGGRHLVYLPKYLAPADPAFDLPDEQIEAEFLAGLERMYPSFRRDDVLAFRISRVRHVFPIATIGYSDRLPPMITSVPGLYVVNSSHIVNGTLNVNETVQLANTATDYILMEPQAQRRQVVVIAN
jgi:protoporphyrinogen oxidase